MKNQYHQHRHSLFYNGCIQQLIRLFSFFLVQSHSFQKIKNFFRLGQIRNFIEDSAFFPQLFPFIFVRIHHKYMHQNPCNWLLNLFLIFATKEQTKNSRSDKNTPNWFLCVKSKFDPQYHIPMLYQQFKILSRSLSFETCSTLRLVCLAKVFSSHSRIRRISLACISISDA